MKRILSIFVLIFMVCVASGKENHSGSKQSVPLRIDRKQHTDKILRSPVQLPIEVYYDSDVHTICIYADSDLQGDVCLYHDGTLIDSSPEINVTFPLPFSYGEYTVNITGDWWEATAVVEL